LFYLSVVLLFCRSVVLFDCFSDKILHVSFCCSIVLSFCRPVIPSFSPIPPFHSGQYLNFYFTLNLCGHVNYSTIPVTSLTMLRCSVLDICTISSKQIFLKLGRPPIPQDRWCLHSIPFTIPCYSDPLHNPAICNIAISH
jgi:hypothetical protein